MNKLLLLTGKDCHLCDQAKFLFTEIDLDKFPLEEVDIYSKRLYLDKYWDKIPVVLFKEKESSLLKLPVNEILKSTSFNKIFGASVVISFPARI